MRYVMMICGDENAWDDTPAEVLEAATKETYAWFEKWGGAGKVVEGGAELQHSRTAKNVHAGPNGVTISDGPFMETKEGVGGFVLLECDTMDEALEVAATWPGLSYPSVTIEVRPIVEH